MKRLLTYLTIALLAQAALVGLVKAQESAPSPLTDVQKLSIINAAKDVEIASLRLDAAKSAMQKLIDANVPSGYQLNEKLDLVKIEKPKPTEPAR